MRATDNGRAQRRMVPILTMLALVAATFPLFGVPATAAPTKTCRVANTNLGNRYPPSTGSSLQVAIAEAASGNTLEIQGRCVGTFTIGTTSLTLIGVASRKFPVVFLDGNGADAHVVTVTAASAVTFTNLDITGAHCTTSCSGGGISNLGTVVLAGSSQVSGNIATAGGGISNGASGIVILENTSTVSGNTSTTSAGGILDHGTIVLNDTSSVSGNTAGTVGGGIATDTTGTVTLNDASSVSENIASVNAGAIFNLGGITLRGTSVVSGNQAAGVAGGILTGAGGTVTLNGSSSVIGNTAVTDGGGIYNNNGSVTLNDSTSVTENAAGDRGGGIFIVTGSLALNGSAMVTGNTALTCPEIYPCT